MITFYYNNKANVSNKKAIDWFESRGIQVHKVLARYMSRKDLLHILSISDNGFDSILKNKLISKNELQKTIENLQTSNFNQTLDVVLNTPEVLKSPIIFDSDKLLVGFNEDEIRQFIPKEYRTGTFY